MLLGCSNMTGRFWTGSVWYFLDPDSAPHVDKCLTGIECETGVTDGKFLEDKQKVGQCMVEGWIVLHFQGEITLKLSRQKYTKASSV
jgi:hypothetical protein